MNQTETCPTCKGVGWFAGDQGDEWGCLRCQYTGRIFQDETPPDPLTDADAMRIGKHYGRVDPSEAEGDELLGILQARFGMGTLQPMDVDAMNAYIAEAHAAITAWHTKQVMEIIGEDEPSQGIWDDETADRRNALRAEQRTKLKEARL